MRRHLAYAAAGAVVLALTGCGDDPEPRVADPTSTPSSSSSPSESAAAEKEPWKEKTDDGAVAFVEHWLSTFNEMQSTGETVAFRELATIECETCANFVSLADETYSGGGRIQSDGWRLKSASPTSLDVPGGYQLALSVRQMPQKVYETAKAEPESFPGGTVTFLATVVWTNDGWRMDSWEFPG